ncbi:MAG: PEP-CTERM sorting domain-containing protein [Cycloclasticus sp.]
MKKMVHKCLLLGLLLGASITAQAAFQSEPCHVTDVTITAITADVCVGSFEGNDNLGAPSTTSANLNTIFGQTNSVFWDKTATWENRGASTNLTATSNSLTYTGSQPLSSPFIVILKASSEYSAYLFKSLADISSGQGGSFIISFLNNGGNTPDISHINIYTTQSTIPDTSVFGNPVPLPAALWLFGPALLGFMGFRKKAKV